MSVLDIYKKPAALDRFAHKGLKVRAPADASFAAAAHSIVLGGAEFALAAKEFPIVFARDGERLVPVAVTGLEEGENLFVGTDSKWSARYVPAFIRQYPFVLAQVGETEMAVCIDEASPALNREDGVPLFDEDGKNSPALDEAVRFLQDFHANLAATSAVLATIEEAGVLSAVDVRFDLAGGNTYNLAGCVMVDEKGVAALGDEQALALMRGGALHLIHAHWISLTNFAALLELKDKRGQKNEG